MAFTRSFLKALGLSDEQVTAAIDEHVAVTDALKKQRDEYKAQAEKLPELQKQIDAAASGEDYKAKYEEAQKALDDFKAETARKETQAKLEAAYRKLLSEEKISAKRVDAVIRLTDFTGMKLDKDGNLQNADALREQIKTDWSDYITETHERGANVETPPQGKKSAMTREEIFKRDDHGRYVLSTEERQKAIAENPQAFR
jgi:hypothetical protein